MTFPELVERTASAPDVLTYVLAQEVAAGRVVEMPEGGYALDPATFPREVLRGLWTLSSLRPSAELVGAEDAA